MTFLEHRWISFIPKRQFNTTSTWYLWTGGCHKFSWITLWITHSYSVHFSKVSSERQAWRESSSIPSLRTGLSINRPRFTQSVDKKVRLTCGEMSAVGWVGRWRGWSGWASRDGTASSWEPGSGCACTLDLWTTKSLCLCSERQKEKTKRRKLLLKNNDRSPNTSSTSALSQDSYLPNHVHTQPSCIPTEKNNILCISGENTSPHCQPKNINHANIPIFPWKITLQGMRTNPSSKPPCSPFSYNHGASFWLGCRQTL